MALGNGVVLPGVYVASVEYVKYGTTESILRTAYGSTKKSAAMNLFSSFEYDRASELIDDDCTLTGYGTKNYNNPLNYINSFK